MTSAATASFNWRAPFELLANTATKLFPLSLLLLVQRRCRSIACCVFVRPGEQARDRGNNGAIATL